MPKIQIMKYETTNKSPEFRLFQNEEALSLFCTIQEQDEASTRVPSMERCLGPNAIALDKKNRNKNQMRRKIFAHDTISKVGGGEWKSFHRNSSSTNLKCGNRRDWRKKTNKSDRRGNTSALKTNAWAKHKRLQNNFKYKVDYVLVLDKKTLHSRDVSFCSAWSLFGEGLELIYFISL